MKHFEILGGKAHVVELPEASEFPRIENGTLKAERTHNDYSTSLVRLNLPAGNWKIVGRLSEVTEAEAGELVDKPYTAGIEQYTKPNDLTEWVVSEAPMGTKYSKTMYKGYRDYTKDPDSYSVREANPFKTAIESLESAILADGYHLDLNPMGSFDEFDMLVFNHSKERLNEWKEVQSRVLSRERTLILRRVDL